MKCSRLCWLSTVFGLFLSAGYGATLVDFQGSDIPGGSTRTPYDFDDGATKRINFNISRSLFSAGGIPDLEFVGGIEVLYAAQEPQLRSSIGYRENQFWVQTDDPTDTGNSYAKGLFLWPASGGYFTFDDTGDSTLSLNITQAQNNNEARFVVVNDGVYYMSEASRSSAGVFTINSFSGNAAQQWGVITPSATDFFIPDSLPAFSATSFDNVSAVGIIFTSENLLYGNEYGFDAFTATGTEVILVPEASSTTLIVVGSMLLLWFRRIRGNHADLVAWNL